MRIDQKIIGIIGLGYVGLPLALAFSKKTKVVGFDISERRISSLQGGVDETGECDLNQAGNITFTNQEDGLSEVNFFIITVPTPINSAKVPDISALKQASKLVGRNLYNGETVVYESTVYPGVTQDICIPILEKTSNLKLVKCDSLAENGFYVGYSPERINPGDNSYKLENIVKVVSGCTPNSSELIANVYRKICYAGVHMAPSIKVAEAAKIIENTQRDINIALINELSILFQRMNIDINDVLSAAKTKWNFLDFFPGLVGGHCIGVDPYYLAHAAKKEGMSLELVESARRINDSMAESVASRVLRTCIANKMLPHHTEILFLGSTFKPNVSDIRNSQAINLVNLLSDMKFNVEIFDPLVDADILKKRVPVKVLRSLVPKNYSMILYAVDHNIFRDRSVFDFTNFGKHQETPIIFDLTSRFSTDASLKSKIKVHGF